MVYLRVEDADEIQSVVDRVLPGMRIAPLAGRGLACGFEVVESGCLRLVRAAWTSGARLEALGERFVLTLAVAGVAEHEHGGERVTTEAGRWASFGTPGRSLSSQLPVGYQARSVSIEPAAFEAHAALVAGAPRPTPQAPAVRIDLTAGVGATLVPLLDALGAAERHAAGAPVLVASLRDALMTALVQSARPATMAAAGVARSAPSAAVRRVEAYVDAHARAPIVLAELVAVAGVSVRALQAGFQAARGQSPMAFVQARRLAYARADLLAAGPDTTVAAVARRLGFVAAGRFSLAYRRCFGERPSQTLARARR